jgi:hypothetical protein
MIPPVTQGEHRGGETMAASFKGAHFPQDIILTSVRWYVAYPLSTRHVEELMEGFRRKFSSEVIWLPSSNGEIFWR